MDDEDIRRKPDEVPIGGELGAMSVEELRARITVLEAEILRIKAALQSREGTYAAAENLFRK